MRKLYTGVLLMIILWFLQACNNSAKNISSKDTDSITSADSINAVKQAAPLSTVPLDSADALFIATVARACITESALARLSLQNAQNKRLKNFGTIMIKDIANAEKRLQVLSKSKHVTLPVAPDDREQKAIDSLAKKRGKDFDKAYVNYIMADHKVYISLFDTTSKNSADRDIKSFAGKSLVRLKNHLDAINMIHDSMK